MSFFFSAAASGRKSSSFWYKMSKKWSGYTCRAYAYNSFRSSSVGDDSHLCHRCAYSTKVRDKSAVMSATTLRKFAGGDRARTVGADRSRSSLSLEEVVEDAAVGGLGTWDLGFLLGLDDFLPGIVEKVFMYWTHHLFAFYIYIHQPSQRKLMNLVDKIVNCTTDLKNYAILMCTKQNLQSVDREAILKKIKRLNDELYDLLGVEEFNAKWDAEKKGKLEKMDDERVDEMDAIRKACEAEKEEIWKACDAKILEKWEKMNADKIQEKDALKKLRIQSQEQKRYKIQYANRIGAGFNNYWFNKWGGKRSQRRNNKKTNKQPINHHSLMHAGVGGRGHSRRML